MCRVFIASVPILTPLPFKVSAPVRWWTFGGSEHFWGFVHEESFGGAVCGPSKAGHMDPDLQPVVAPLPWPGTRGLPQLGSSSQAQPDTPHVSPPRHLMVLFSSSDKPLLLSQCPCLLQSFKFIFYKGSLPFYEPLLCFMSQFQCRPQAPQQEFISAAFFFFYPLDWQNCDNCSQLELWQCGGAVTVTHGWGEHDRMQIFQR